MPMEWLPAALARLTGVEPAEVHQVLNGRPLHAIPVERQGARLLLVFGRTREGRILLVIIRPRPSFDSQILWAREATTSEAQAHRAWEEEQS
ncbi:hypothetical protein [Stackebrandtia albiflava]|uniref:hypothetical protein n=1 Tax=Stackebrandtia albiflava TaxID=406432 RepID=UPI001315AC86|nr:hypothetical protein [Stackebrandtia albiflava]